ncbi:thioredoxin [Amycolatopsis azurea]|uniref:Thioredoxin n=1 Tax=Amycolatopsis azurea DSM 43854 TaxID=1238180 RepID=M2QP34_9PSEU|nr:thioredoxin [Amycolatopsis azurea]EMD27582.1 Thioredoxin [Amycolatopsis azurea DSM 43854]OOC02997.1 thiol reductase thioredoxin [Amycolatopsis azurea DSM 43854]
MSMRSVTTATFAAEVLEQDRPVLVDFWAPWCGPCKALAPVLTEIAEEHRHELAVVKVDIDDNPEIAVGYDVMSIPTVILFVDGKPAATITGAQPKAKILDSLTPWL